MPRSGSAQSAARGSIRIASSSGSRCFCQTLSAVEVIDPAVPLSALPRRSLQDLLRFTSLGGYQRRVRVTGNVTLVDGRRIFLRDESGAALMQLVAPAKLHVGDDVEIVGFASAGTYGPTLEDGEIVTQRAGHPLPPRWEQPERLSAGFADSDLVAIEARLVEAGFGADQQSLLLTAHGRTFTARLHGPLSAWQAPPVPGSWLRVTGVSEAVINGDANPIDATTFDLLLRSPADVVVLRSPSWWTVERTMGVLAVLALLVGSRRLGGSAAAARSRTDADHPGAPATGDRSADALSRLVRQRERSRLHLRSERTLHVDQPRGGAGHRLSAPRGADDVRHRFGHRRTPRPCAVGAVAERDRASGQHLRG